MIAFKIKNALARWVDARLNLDRVIAKKPNMRVVLAYHRVLPRGLASEHRIQDAMWVSTELFEQQLTWLKTIGHIVPLRDIVNFKHTSNHPLFCITFDDGWRDNYEYAFPILKKLEVPSTIFLATGAIESGRGFWVEELLQCIEKHVRINGIEQLAHELTKKGFNRPNSLESIWSTIDALIERLKLLSEAERKSEIHNLNTSLNIQGLLGTEREMMNWTEIQEMAKNGVDFQSHTHSHKILKYLRDDEIALELTKSKQLIEKNLNSVVDIFCYPNARYPSGNKSMLYAANGYKFGIKIDNQLLNEKFDPYCIPRLLMNQDNSGNMAYLKLRLLEVPKY